jgi:hypothetical protein
VAFNSESAKEARAKAAPRGESRIKKLFKDYAEEEDVKALFEKLKEKAVGGDMDAIKTLLSYLIGKPKESVDVTTNGESINTIRIVDIDGTEI